MTDHGRFGAFETSVRIDLKFEGKGPVLVRAGGASPPELPDMAFVRYPTEFGPVPFLPGSSIKGVLRNGVEQLLRGTSQQCCDPFAANTCGKGQPENRCPACLLFGSTLGAGVLAVEDAVPWPEGCRSEKRRQLVNQMLAQSSVRNGVGIDRATGSSRSNVLFDFEVLNDPVFYGALVFRNPTVEQLGLVCATFELFKLGVFRIGGMTTRGLGHVSLIPRNVTIVATSTKAAQPLLREVQQHFGDPTSSGLLYRWDAGGQDADPRQRLEAVWSAVATWSKAALPEVVR